MGRNLLGAQLWVVLRTIALDPSTRDIGDKTKKTGSRACSGAGWLEMVATALVSNYIFFQVFGLKRMNTGRISKRPSSMDNVKRILENAL